MANHFGVKVAVSLNDAAKQGESLRKEIQSALNSSTKSNPITVKDVTLNVPKNLRSSIQKELDGQTKANPIQIKHVSASFSKSDISAITKSLASSINGKELTVKIASIDATSAVENLRKQLTTMLSGLSIGGLKEFVGTDGINKAVLQSAEKTQKALEEAQTALAQRAASKAANNSTLNSLSKQVNKVYGNIDVKSTTKERVAELANEMSALNTLIEKAKTTEGEAQDQAIRDITERVAAYQKEASSIREAADAAKLLKAQQGQRGKQDMLADVNSEGLTGLRQRIDLAKQSLESLSNVDVRGKIGGNIDELSASLERIQTLSAEAQTAAIKEANTTLSAITKQIVAAANAQKAADTASRNQANKQTKSQSDADAIIGSLKTRIAEVRTQIDELNKLGGDGSALETSLADIEARLKGIADASGVARTELKKSLQTEINQVGKEVSEAISSTPNVEALKIYEAQLKELKSDAGKISDDAAKKAEITAIQEQIDAVNRLKEANAEQINAEVDGIRDAIDARRDSVNGILEQQKAEKEASEALTRSKKASSMLSEIKTWTESNTTAAKKYRETIEGLTSALQKGGSLSKEELKQIETQWAGVKNAAVQAGVTGRSVLDTLIDGWKRFGGWSIVTKSMMNVVNTLKQMLQAVRDVDSAMTELKKVTDLSAASYEKFKQQAASSAIKTGASLSDTINATADFSRLGYNINESAQLAEAALIYKNVGDGISDISESTESLISTLKAFDIEASKSKLIVDEFNEVGNRFSISSSGIGEALIRSAAALASAGNSLEESIGLVTAMNAVVQNPDSVGTALKTVSMYLRASKTDAEAAGIATDGMAESVSKLRDSLLSLTGVDIMKDKDTYKNTYESIKELSAVWKSLSDITQANVLEQLGGKRNANVVAALLNNFEDAEAAMKAAQNAAGSATAENEKYLDSINGKLQKTQALFQSISSEAINSDLVKFLLDVGNGLMSIVDFLAKANALLPSIVMAVGALYTHANQKKAASAVEQILFTNGLGVDDDTISVLKNAMTSLTDIQKQYAIQLLSSAAESGNFSGAVGDQIEAIKKAQEAMASAGAGTLKFGFSLSTLKQTLLATISTVPGMILAVTAIYGTIKNIVSWSEQRQQEQIDKANELQKAYGDLNNTYKSNVKTLNGLRAEYSKLAKGIGDQGQNVGLTADEYERYWEIVDQIVDISPDVVSGYDSERHAILDYKDAIDQAIDAQDKLRSAKIEQMKADAPDYFKGKTAEYKDTSISDIETILPDYINNMFRHGSDGTISESGFIDRFKQSGYDIDFSKSFGTTILQSTAKDILDNVSAFINVLKDINKDVRVVGTDALGIQYGLTDKAITNLESSLMAAAQTYQTSRQILSDEADYLVAIIREDTATKTQYASLPNDLAVVYQKTLASQLEGVKNYADAKDIADSLLRDFVSQIDNDDFRQMEWNATKLKNGEMEIEEYNAELEAYIQNLREAGRVEIADSVEQYFRQQTSEIGKATNAVNAYKVAVSSVPNGIAKAYKSLSSGQSIANQAIAEMVATGGISASTLSSIAGELGEGESITDYIDMENGALKLNIGLWNQKHVAQQTNADMDVIRANLEELNGINKTIEAIWGGDKKMAEEAGRLMNVRSGFLETNSPRATQEDLVKKGHAYVGNGAASSYAKTVTIGRDGADFEYDKDMVITVSYVMPDGSVLSDDELDGYIQNQINLANYTGSDLEAMFKIPGTKNPVMDITKVTDAYGGLDQAVIQAERDLKRFQLIQGAALGQVDGSALNEAYAANEAAIDRETKMLAMYENALGAASQVGGTEYFKNTVSQIDAIGSSSKNLLDALEKTKEGTKLTADELRSLATEYPDLLKSGIFDADSASAQAAIIQESVDGITDSIHTLIDDALTELVEKQDGLMKEAKVDAAEYASAMQQLYGIGGTVDLSKRPKISGDKMTAAGWGEYVDPESISTVLSNTYGSAEEGYMIALTPITPEGDEILSPEDLDAYFDHLIAGVEDGKTIEELDTKHLVLSSMFGSEEELAPYQSWFDAFGEGLHQMQEAYYAALDSGEDVTAKVATDESQALQPVIDFFTSLAGLSAEAIFNTNKQETAVKSLADSYAAVQSAQSGASIYINAPLSYDDYENLIAINAEYADAVEYQNGVMTVNAQKYNEITQKIVDQTRAQAEAEAQAIINSKRYEDLNDRYDELSEAEHTELELLNAKIKGYVLLANNLDNVTVALNRFKNASGDANTDEYSTGKAAVDMINNVLYNKKSELYGHVGNAKYQEAIKLLISPEIEVDSKEFKAQMKKLTKYFTGDDMGTEAFYNDLVKNGFFDQKTKEFIGDLDSVADKLNISKDAARLLFEQLNEHFDEEHKIKIDFEDDGADEGADAIDGMSKAADEAQPSLDEMLTTFQNIETVYGALKDAVINIKTSSAYNGISNLASAMDHVLASMTEIRRLGSIEVSADFSGGGRGSTTPPRLGDLLGGKRVSGNAAAGGSSDADGKTLVGELGREIVVDPMSGKWRTVGDRGAEFVNLPKGAIVFNAEETRQLLGSAGYRASGNAMASGSPSTLKKLLNGVFNGVFGSKTNAAMNTVSNTVSSKIKQGLEIISGGGGQLPSFSSSKKSSGSGKSSGGKSSSEKELTVLEEIEKKYEEINNQSEHLIEHQEYLYKVSDHAMDFKGMQASLQEQIRLYRVMMDDAQKAVNEMIANGATDTDEELQNMERVYWDAYDNLYSKLDELNKLYVDGLNDKIDGIQSAYKNLHTAADEFNKSGTISVDTFQSLVDGGVQYLSLLNKVGDKYVINEEGIQRMVAAQKSQLAMESALSYIGQIRNALNENQTNTLKNLVDLSNDVSDATWSYVYAQAAALKGLGLSDQQYSRVVENIKALQAIANTVTGSLSDSEDDISKSYTEQGDALDEILSLTKDLIKQETQDRIDAINDKIDGYQKILDLKKESLKTSKDENEYAKNIAEKTKEMAQIQAKMDQLSLDTSREAQAKRAELADQFTKLQEELAKLQGDHSYDAQVDALDKEGDAYKESRQEEIDKLNNSISSAEKLYQLAIDRLKNGWSTLYDDLIAWNTEAGNSLNSEITESWEKALEAVKKYGSYVEAVAGIKANKEGLEGTNTIVTDTSKLPKYHGGGVVDSRGAINEDEVVAVLNKGEGVLDKTGLSSAMQLVDLGAYFADKLGVAVSGIRAVIDGASLFPVLDAISGSRVTELKEAQTAQSPIVFSPNVEVSISHNGEMSDSDAERYGREIADTALDRFYRAFTAKGISPSVGKRLKP